MINYEMLKTDKSDIPAYDSFLPIELKMLSEERRNWQGNEVEIKAVNYVESLNSSLKPNHDKLIQRAEFALSYLYSQYGLVNRPARATYMINNQGLRLLQNYNTYPEIFDAIKKLPRLSKQSKGGYRKSQKRSNNAYDDNINYQVVKHNRSLRGRLLNKIMTNSPSFFEYLVTTLLEKMGYQGSHGHGITTQQTRDHGIDGIINQDPLGTRTLLIQAKRYKTGHNIPGYQIQSFYGAVKSKGAGRGVFITTSDFTNDAIKQAKNLSIIIINGKQLTNLMLKYHVGVQVKSTYQILSIDNDFFDE